VAISGYNNVSIDNNIPFNNDPGQEFKDGDMLYWNTEYNVFQVGPGISNKLSDFTNDLGYLTEQQVVSLLANITSGGTINLDGYVTENELATAINNIVTFSGDYNDLVNKPVIPSIAGLATTTYVDAAVANVEVDLTDYATRTYVDTAISNALTGGIDLADYALKSELFSGDYNDLTNKPNLANYASQTYVNAQIATAISTYDTSLNLSNFITQTELTTAISAIPRFSGNYNDLVNKPIIFSGDYNDLINRPVLFSGSYNDLTDVPDLNTYATKTYVAEQITSALTGGTIDLSSYVTDTELANALAGIQHPTNVSAFTNDAGYINSSDLSAALANYQPSVDLTNYVTKTELSNELANYQPTIDLSNYYNKSQVDVLISNVSAGNVDLSAYYTSTQVNSLLGSYVTNNTLTTSLANYYTSSQVDTLLSNLQTGGVNLLNYYTVSQVDNIFQDYYNRTEVDNIISNAVLQASGISGLDDIEDVAIGGLPDPTSTDNYGIIYNPSSSLWESKNLNNTFATKDYVTATLASVASGGVIDLDGYATENYVNQKMLEVGPHFSGNYYDLTNRPELFSGNYSDLFNKPVLTEYTLENVGTTLNLVETKAIPGTIIASVDFGDMGIAFSGDYDDLTNKPTLFSGNYQDLANKPYIPSIAGLATEDYVDDRLAESVIYGSKQFTNVVTFENYIQQKVSTSESTAVKRDYVLTVQTTNDLETEVLLQDSSKIPLETGATAMFSVTIVASSGIDKSARVIKGIIDNTGGVISLVGNNIVEIISDGGQGWTVDVNAGEANSSLNIVVKGSASTTVDWTVFVEISEVIR
jgi:hypothetical protein